MLRPCHKTVEYLYQRNGFTPILPNNPIYSQGYFGEIQTFVDAVENHDTEILSSLPLCRTLIGSLMKSVFRMSPLGRGRVFSGGRVKRMRLHVVAAQRKEEATEEDVFVS